MIQTGIYLRANEIAINLHELHEMVRRFCANDANDIEISLLNPQKISKEDYNSYLPKGMTYEITPEFDSHSKE